VVSVAPASPGERAGVAVGDVIETVGGRRASSLLDWEARLLDARVGEPLTLAVRRTGSARTIQVTPADLPSLGAERVHALANLELVTLTPAIRSERRLVSDRGALIVSLSDDARQIGLAEGDLIVEINRVPINSAAEAANALRSLAGRGAIRIMMERQGRLVGTSFYVRG
jgi:serine protease Do